MHHIVYYFPLFVYPSFVSYHHHQVLRRQGHSYRSFQAVLRRKYSLFLPPIKFKEEKFGLLLPPPYSQPFRTPTPQPKRQSSTQDVTTPNLCLLSIYGLCKTPNRLPTTTTTTQTYFVSFFYFDAYIERYVHNYIYIYIHHPNNCT